MRTDQEIRNQWYDLRNHILKEINRIGAEMDGNGLNSCYERKQIYKLYLDLTTL